MKSKSVEQLPTLSTLMEDLAKTEAGTFAKMKAAAAELEQIRALEDACSAEISQLQGELAELQPVAGVEAGRAFLTKRRQLEGDLIARQADRADIAETLKPLNVLVFESARDALREPVLKALLAAKELWQKQVDDELSSIDAQYHEWSDVCLSVLNLPEYAGVFHADGMCNLHMLRTRHVHENPRLDLIFNQPLSGRPGNS